MKLTINAVVGVLSLLPAASHQHAAILPPKPDKVLQANSSTTPAGCKKLASDKGWPSDSVWKSTFPGIFHKVKGTLAPDWMIQAKTVEDVQKAVNFAREQNIRLTIISTGHDFHGRGTGRSGLRLDMASLREPTVFSTEWKCGTTLKPATTSGKVVDTVEACKVKKMSKRSVGSIPQREFDYKFFEKRDGFDCGRLLTLHKRQHEGMAGMDTHGAPSEIPAFNVIKPKPGQSAYARVSGGMYNELFYNQADKSGLMTVGAQHGGVSVTGGWMQGGGHNPFVNRFGMQVDNVLEIEVVTADGKFQKVSECNNPELYWALRGGGGGTFGVVTGATVRVFPTFPVVVSRFFVNSTKAGVVDATSHFLQQGAKLRDQYGIQGYFYVYPGAFQSALHMPDEFATLENAKKVTEKLMKEMEAIAGTKKHIEPQYYQYKTYKEWYIAEYGDEDMEETGQKFISWYDGSDGPVPSEAAAMDNPLSLLPWSIAYQQSLPKQKRSLQAMAVMRSQASSRHYLDSRLLSDKHVNSVTLKQLSTAVNETMPDIPGIHIRGFLYGGGKQALPKKDAMGLHPAWRDATYHFITNAVPGGLRHDYGMAPLTKLFPDAGGYMNEAAPQEPNWKPVFWGDNYPRLEQIKKKYDPENVFWCVPCVGADLLSYDDERLCKNPAYPQSGPAPQTDANTKSKVGIASLPGGPGIPDPLTPIIMNFMRNKTLPATMLKSNYFKIAMGEGGSAGGKFANMDPYNPGKTLADA